MLFHENRVCTIFNVLSGRLMNSLHNQLERVENPELLPSPNNINKNTVRLFPQDVENLNAIFQLLFVTTGWRRTDDSMPIGGRVRDTCLREKLPRSVAIRRSDPLRRLLHADGRSDQMFVSFSFWPLASSHANSSPSSVQVAIEKQEMSLLAVSH